MNSITKWSQNLEAPLWAWNRKTIFQVTEISTEVWPNCFSAGWKDSLGFLKPSRLMSVTTECIFPRI